MVLSSFTVADQLTLVLRVGLGATLGGVIGLERDRAGKAAGLRTHMLVAASAALAVGLGQLAIGKGSSGDPTRMMHAVFTGIGFIGAGMIWTTTRSNGPMGLTSAATILLVAGIGAAAGIGAPVVATAVTVFALVTLVGLRIVEEKLHIRSHRDSAP